MEQTYEINYKAIGDSITKGVGSLFTKGFADRYASMLVHHLNKPVRTEKIARNKITSGVLSDWLRHPQLFNKLSTANIITVTIGGNDLLNANRQFLTTFDPDFFHHALYEYERNIHQIIQTIYSAKQYNPTPIYLFLVGLYNPFPHYEHGDYWVTQLNRKLKGFTNEWIRYVDLYTIFKFNGPSLMSFGGIHPNPIGHQIIAEAILQESDFLLTLK